MAGTDYLGRWIDLVAYLLTRPPAHDPMQEIFAELGERFSSTAAGTIDFHPERVRLGVYRYSGGEPEKYAPVVGDHPLAQHYCATNDRHARSLGDARRFERDPWACALLDDLKQDGLRDFVFLPLAPREAMAHRWLGIASSGELGEPARVELDRVGSLIRAIDTQHRVIERSFDPKASWDDRDLGLSSREVAVLGLVSRGMTATAIANRLSISPRTVSKHQQNLYRKLGVGDRLSAVVRAQELGMLSRGQAGSTAPVATIEAAAISRSRSPLQ